MPSHHVRTARAGIAIAVAAAVSTPAFAATDMFLELGPVKGESTDRAAGGKVQLSSINFSASRKGWDGTIKGRTPDHTSASESSAGAGAASADAAVTSPRDTASGMPTGKRQHGTVTISKPLDRGSVTVAGNLPGCTVGAAYADAVLQTAYIRYELKEVMVSSCTVSGSGGGGGGGATESFTLDYASYRESPTRASQK
ncbi:MAG: type VI secretion system tube protein Hcp [Sphingomicrobium sp.]